MIYTITTNPSLDYYLKLDDLACGKLNRANYETYDAAGKGVNVSKFLDKLNIRSVALGFLGGFTKEYYIALLSNYENIQPQFTGISDNTRINIKINAKQETSLNAIGPKITDYEFSKFCARVNQIYDNDYVVLSGNVQDELRDKIVDEIKKLIDYKVKIVLDTDNKVVDALSDYKPYLIKMDKGDLSDLSEENIIKKGKEFTSKGVKYFLFSSNETASYLFEENGYFKCERLNETQKVSTGTNDGMIAGILWSKLKGANSLEMFTYANAIASSVSLLDKKIDLDNINKVYKDIKVERVDYK